MKYKYITIEREYGSGGTQIARRLADECGLPCYGQEILEAVAKKHNISIDSIQKYEENVINSFLYTTYVLSRIQSGNTDLLAREGHLFVAEQNEIKELAANGPAIFLGHCASEALKEYKVLKVFIRCSDGEVKLNRILTDYGIAKDDAEKVRKQYDNKRAKYFYANTTQKWDELKNYDIILDSASLGTDGCVAALKGLI